MKKTILYISALALSVFASSCVELDREPLDSLTESGEFYKDAKGIDMATIACYNGLQACMNDEWYLTELRSDNSRSYATNSTSTQSREIYAMDKFLVETTHPINERYWQSVYHNINNCNLVLKHSHVVEDQKLKDQLEGEAQFIRAYHYFNLVRLYGPVFVVDKPSSEEETKWAERQPVEKVYDFIIQDAKDAISKLPSAHKKENKGRVDFWSAKMLLAKIYLTLGDLADAKTLLEDIKDNSKYGLLTTSYEDVFSISNEMNKEIMFAVRYKAGGFGLGSPFANSFAPANSSDVIITASGDGNNCPTNDLMAQYDLTDARKDVTLAENWKNAKGVTVYTAYVKKFLSPVGTRYDGENDWPVFRFADVLLMLAEIENEQSGVSAALPYLNQTRNRAGLTSLTSADLTNKYAARLAIEKERRLEFALENQRIFDLIRTNRVVDVMENHFNTEQIANQTSGVITDCYTEPKYECYIEKRRIDNWQVLLPIPFSVITVMPNATQNPGY